MESKTKNLLLAQLATLTQILWSDLKVIELLGEGGYGTVHRGQWQNIEVAIKQLHLKKLTGSLLEDFKQEAALMAKCRFPYVTELYGVCTEANHYAMVMAYIPKGSLYEVLHDTNESLPWNPIRWDIGIEIGKGLAYLHGQQIVHRDMKSLNVLLDAQYHAKITDFGMAKLKLQSSSISTQNKKGMGTTRWLAPELFKRGANPNFASDVYGYGMVLWEITSRQLPYQDAQNDTVALSWIKDGEKENIPADCPVEYGQIIQKAWDLPEHRPTASEMSVELEKIKPKPESKPEKPYEEKSWHFDPQTKQMAQLKGKEYVLIPASIRDIQKVIGFYAHHPVPGYGVSKVEVIYNPGFNRAFELHLRKLQQRDNNPAFVPQWSSKMTNTDQRQTTYDLFVQLTQPYVDPDYPAVKLLPAWHGTKPQVLDSLFSAGYANLATTDAGYFGKGYYSAYEAAYSYRVYSKGALILNWVASFSPLPVIDGDMEKLEGKGNYGNYDAHFVPVVPRNPTSPDETIYFPCKENQPHQYTEMVVFDSAALLPRYLVELQPEGLGLKSPVMPVVTPSKLSTLPAQHKTTPPQKTLKKEENVSPTSTNAMGSPQVSVKSPVAPTTAKPLPTEQGDVEAQAKPPVKQGSHYSQTFLTSSMNPTSPVETKSEQSSQAYPKQPSQLPFFPPPPSATQEEKGGTYSQQVERASKALGAKIDVKELSALLKWVTEGHLVEVEKLLKKESILALGTGTVTDLSERTFTNVTALQYAVWAMDIEMCDLIMSYLGAHNRAIQLKALSTEPGCYSSHGASYDMTPLIKKTQKYVDNYDKWKYDECCRYWQKEVGGEQRKCPAWLIYAWNEEGEDMGWTKQDANRKFKREYEKHWLEWWMTQNFDNGRGVGSTWAVWRGEHTESLMYKGAGEHSYLVSMFGSAAVFAMPVGGVDGIVNCVTGGGDASKDIRQLTGLSKNRRDALRRVEAKADSELNQATTFASSTSVTSSEKELEQGKQTPLKKPLQDSPKPPQSPIPQLQPTGQTSPFFPPNQSPKLESKPVLTAQQQEKQNQLVAVCLKGDITLVKQLESQGASLLYPNGEGLYPLVAAVYGCSLETVRYVGLKLKDEAGKQWLQVDANKALENLDRWMPTALSSKATYGELGNWYVKYNGASWCVYYDSECLKRHKRYTNWGGWNESYKNMRWETDSALWGKEEGRVIWHRETGIKDVIRKLGKMQKGDNGDLVLGLLSSPNMSIHNDVVKVIQEQMKELRNEVEIKVKSSVTVFNPF